MDIFKVRACLLLVFVACFGPTAVKGETNETNPDDPRSSQKSAFSMEVIVTKLQVLEYHILKTDLQMDARITNLSSSVDNLVKSIEKLSSETQQTGATVNQLVLDGKQIRQNLSVIQSELGELLAGQKLLLTSQHFEDSISESRCNASNAPNISGNAGSNYTSCSQLPFNVTGVYQIQPEKPFKEPMTVLCDQEYESGGWAVIQHRFEGSVNFYRGWQEYKTGFGNLDGEFWLGLDRIHQITSSRPHELVVLLEDYDGTKTYAKYDRFEIGDEGQKYALTALGAYSGTAGDSLGPQNGMQFSTLDVDNDTWSGSCAVSYTGAWWYAACHTSNLNGQYLRGDTKEYATGMIWNSFRGYHHSLKSSKMMIKPRVA